MSMIPRACRRPAVFFSVLLIATILGSHPGGVARGDFVATFEDQYPGSNTFKNDFRPTNTITTGGSTFNNNYNPTFTSWSGFSVSSKIDNTFGGSDFSHEYGAYAPLGAIGTGSGGSATYGVAYNGALRDAIINLPAGGSLVSMDLTNTTYTAQSISLGDGFARAFHRGDYLLLDILGFSGLNGTGSQTGDVPFYLADFRGNSLLLVSDWTKVALSPLAGATSLAFTLTSTDTGQFGINTPTFFALDNLTLSGSAVPEPSSLILLAGGAFFIWSGSGRLRKRRSRAPNRVSL